MKLRLEDLLNIVSDCLDSQKRLTINYGNVRTMNLVYEDEILKMAMQKADVIYVDGAGLLFGARLLGKSLPCRMTGADWIYDLCELARRKRYSLFLLGGHEGVAQEAGRVLQERFPGLDVVGTHHGYFNRKDSRPVVHMINQSRPHILLVGMGSPIQEKWIFKYRGMLDVSICWAVGGLFNFVTGRERRAPAWMNDHSLEWLFRLVQDPKRLWKRYVVGNPVFILRVVKQLMHEKLLHSEAAVDGE